MAQLDRALPHNLDAERSILGAVILDNAALKRLHETHLQPKHFFLTENHVIYERMLELEAASVPIDDLTLIELLQRTNELERIGGAAYVISLTGGMPRVSNVEHYARIVIEKFDLREMAHGAHRIWTRCLENLTSAEDMRAQLELLLKSASANGNGKAKHRVVDLTDFLVEDLRPRDYILYPMLPTQGMVMVYAKRGIGKTYFITSISYAASLGRDIFGWECRRKTPTLYVDGEMPANEFQDRLRKLYRGHDGASPERGFLRLFTPDMQGTRGMPNIATAEGQRIVEGYLQEGMLLILDNLSTLCRGSGKENEAESWNSVQEWLLYLRQKMITCVIVHHAGKGGDQRGTSAKEDMLDTVVRLSEPHDYSQAEGARFEVHFTKLRREPGGAPVFPFELRLDDNGAGGVMWVRRALHDVIEQQAFQMFHDGCTDRDVMEALHQSRFQVYRLRKKYKTSDHMAK